MDQEIKSWMVHGCACPSCMKSKMESYKKAYEEYAEHGKLDITLKEWSTEEDWGTDLIINGHYLKTLSGYPEETLGLILEFMNFP